MLPEYARRGGKTIATPVTLEMVGREVEAAQKQGATLVARGEPGYPPLLAHLDAPPPLLYIKGNADLAHLPAVAIVGSRNASAIGQKFTRRALPKSCQMKAMAIVSGLARGIDTAAHFGALQTATIAVIAGGIGNVLPATKRGFAAPD